MNCMIPERRNLFTDNDCYKRTLFNGVVECFSKEYYNPNFTRKDSELENIKKELLLLEIDNYLL